jgi:hypothetical protein
VLWNVFFTSARNGGCVVVSCLLMSFRAVVVVVVEVEVVEVVEVVVVVVVASLVICDCRLKCSCCKVRGYLVVGREGSKCEGVDSAAGNG